MPQAKTEVALRFLECCAADTALQHSLFCSADVMCTRSCAAANEKLHCNIEIAALQESGAFLPLSCGFQAPTFRQPRFGLADELPQIFFRICFRNDHVGQAQATTAGQTYEINQNPRNVLSLSLSLSLSPPERKIQNPGIFVVLRS